MNRIVFALTLGVAVGSFGCQKEVKEATQTTPARPTEQPAPAPQPAAKEPEPAPQAPVKAACGEAPVHFALDSSELSSTDKDLLQQTYTCFKNEKKAALTIEGHADERGTEEYNMSLGEHRAVNVSKYLQKLGASKGKLKTVSYGKANPLCSDHSEECWSQNRRALVKSTDK